MKMKAMVLNGISSFEENRNPLKMIDLPVPLPREKEIKSVANVARRDISEFLELAAQIPIRPEIQEFRLEEANKALAELKDRKIRGAKVLRFD
jgi:propanol-preferring alcohol dehydrogenase